MSITFKRILAYFFDVIVVSLVSSMISGTTINPNYESILNLNQEYQSVTQDLQNKMNELDESNEDEVNEILNEALNVNKNFIWRSNRYAIFENILTVILLILYFGVFAYFFEGETVGKRMMKLKITSLDDKRVSFLSLLIRVSVLQAIPLVIIGSILPFILNEDAFLIASIIINLLSSALSITILVTTFSKKDNRGLHDMLAKTKVIQVERSI